MIRDNADTSPENILGLYTDPVSAALLAAGSQAGSAETVSQIATFGGVISGGTGGNAGGGLGSLGSRHGGLEDEEGVQSAK